MENKLKAAVWEALNNNGGPTSTLDGTDSHVMVERKDFDALAALVPFNPDYEPDTAPTRLCLHGKSFVESCVDCGAIRPDDRCPSCHGDGKIGIGTLTQEPCTDCLGTGIGKSRSHYFAEYLDACHKLDNALNDIASLDARIWDLRDAWRRDIRAHQDQCPATFSNCVPDDCGCGLTDLRQSEIDKILTKYVDALPLEATPDTATASAHQPSPKG